MKIGSQIRINFQKLRVYKTRALFLIIPITTLVALSVVVSSQIQNIKTASDESIFGTIQEQSRLIELSKEMAMPIRGSSGGGATFSISGQDNAYNESELSAIKAIANVETAAINYNVPVSNITATDLLESEFTIPNLIGMESSLAGLYTEDDFQYVDGEAIPIIVNANTFIKMYEDWQGKDSFTQDLSKARQGGGPMSLESPIKSEAMDYDRSSLIGKEFTLTVGGLSDLETYTTEFTDSGITFKKKSADTLASEEAARKDAISKYWDYSKINKPLTYKFVVVGVIEDEGSFNSYVPEAFAKKMMSDYVGNQLDARNSTEIPVEALGDTYQGISFDGVEINTSASFPAGARMIRIGGGPGISDDDSDSAQYQIPGLVLKTERDESSQSMFGNQAEIEGVHTDRNVYENAAKSGSTILVKIKDIYSRSQVIEDLNDAGFAYQDLFKSDVFAQMQSTLATVAVGFTIGFIGIITLIIFFTIGKFVSEGRREIGILRALGVTRGDIRNLFVSQSVIYTAVSLALGLGLGILLNLAVSQVIYSAFSNLINTTIKETYGVVNEISSGIFTKLDVDSMAIYAGIAIILAIIISLVPAIRASRLSPVVAIKGE